jgi:hypothetical protein
MSDCCDTSRDCRSTAPLITHVGSEHECEVPLLSKLGTAAGCDIEVRSTIGRGPVGPAGPPGPVGGNIRIELVPAAEWPPVDPIDEVLYLKGQ